MTDPIDRWAADMDRERRMNPDPLQIPGDEPDLTDHATRATGVWLSAVVVCFAGMALLGAVALLYGRTHQ